MLTIPSEISNISIMKTIYVISGTRSTFIKKCIKAFESEQEATNYINSQKLKKPRKDSTYSGKICYRDGYYDMDYEEIELKK